MAALVALALFLARQGAEELPFLEPDRITNAEHAARRAAVKAWMPKGSVAVILTNPERNRSNDTDFRFHPEVNFWYLTGFPEPDAALLLAPDGITVDGKRVTELLVVNDRDPAQETWTGYRFGPERAASRLGVEMAVSNKRFAEMLKAVGSAPILKGLEINAPSGPVAIMGRMADEAATGRDRPGGLAGQLARMRAVKSPAEIGFLKRAVAATVVGHREAIRTCEPGMREYDLQAVVEYAFARGGCESVGYNSIIGAGPDSCTLHYEADRRPIEKGEMICMDVAGEYHGYSADVTRSFPAGGTFSKEQRTIYDLVLAAQDAGIAACRPGAPFRATHDAARKVLLDGLTRLGIVKDPKELGRYFPHGTSHTIGLDVHDSAIGVLAPNVLLTVEPGIYIPAGSPCDPKWWNIGVRIEDDVLVTDGDPVVLSAGAPRKAVEIEALMREKGIGNVKIGA